MFPTLKENQRLLLNRTYRITKNYPERGDIITFEAPSVMEIPQSEVDQSKPMARYEKEPTNIFSKFVYYVVEVTKKSFIKRVIALPGEHVKIENNAIYINGEKLEEDYLREDVKTESEKFNDFIVPEGYIFAVGDNREHSTDCRSFGCIPINKLEGKVIFRLWPFDVFGKI